MLSSNGRYGLRIGGSTKNHVNNTSVHHNKDIGIYISGSSNGTIIDNSEISNNFAGVRVYYTHQVTLRNCKITNNTSEGLLLCSASENTIYNCIISNNTDGIEISGTNNTIENCEISMNSVCNIYLFTFSYNNTLTSLRVSCASYGIRLDSSINNTITKCNISCNDYGIYIPMVGTNGVYSHSNFIHHNNFINNTLHAYDTCANFWHNGTVGNYWDDYTGTDDDGNGVGDTPYTISGGDNKDNFPLMHEFTWWDTEKPVISLISPENNSVIKHGTVIEFEIEDDNLWKAIYCVDNGDIQFFSSDYNISTDGWEDGTYNITIYAKDWGMNENIEIFTFTIDSISPNISLISPDNNSLIKPGTIIDFEINDLYLNITTYTLNDGLPITLSSPYNLSTEGWGDGTHNITVYADDLAGNEISKTFRFTIDGAKPTINITGVINEEYYNTNVTPMINISDAHLNEDETITTLNDMSFVSGTEVSAEGKHTLYIYAVDKAGNNISKTITFTIDKTKPIIVVSGVADGAYYNTDVAPVVDVSDANIDITSITLNGNSFTSGNTVSTENTYTLVVQVNDKAGNTANKTITFTIDKTAPTITIAESSQTINKNTFTVSWSASEDIRYYEVSTDGVNWENVSMATQHTFTLSKGDNTLYVRGTDFAGNKGTNMITVTYQEKKGKPAIIPGFETAMFFVVLGICIILLKRKKFP
jgi:parallel beta-helix repeat protein